MTIYIGADHRGFELKNKLIEWLKEQKYDVEDCGNTVLDPEDDYPDFANAVAKTVILRQAQNDHSLGIVICGSGIGVSVAANRHRGIICGLGFDIDQIRHARENDHINVLSIPSDYVDFEKAKELVIAFVGAVPKMEEKYLRRAKKLNEIS